MIPAEITYGNFPLLLDAGNGTIAPDGTLDTDTIEVLCESAAWPNQMAELGYARYQKVPGAHAMFVEEFSRGSLAGNLVEVTARIVGLREPGEKRKRIISAGSQQISIGPVEKTIVAWVEGEIGDDDGTPVEEVRRRVPKLDENGDPENILFVTPSGAADRWSIGEAILTVSDTYFVTTKPSTQQTQTELTPPNAPLVPPYNWSGYNEPLRGRHPNGWVLDNREIDELFPPVASTPGLYAIRDTYGFYYAATPD